MSKTVIIKMSIACANQARVVLEAAQKEVACYHNTENAEDNYNHGLSYAYLECAIAAIKEAIDEC